MNIQHSQSDNELTGHLPLAKAANDAERRVLYSVPVIAKAGDILVLTVASELTNPNAQIVGVGRFFALGGTPIDTNSQLISPARVGYIFGGGNHTALDHATQHVFDADFAGFVNFIAYAYSPAGGADIIVNGWQANGQAYGEIKSQLFTNGGEWVTLRPVVLDVHYPAPKKSLWQRIFGG